VKALDLIERGVFTGDDVLPTGRTKHQRIALHGAVTLPTGNLRLAAALALRL
jgi:hypothetical protein